MKSLEKKILVGITGWTDKHWQDKLRELAKHEITTAALFLEKFKKAQRQKIYPALLKSNIRHIPLVHARNDMDKEEYIFLAKHFKTRYFTLHEDYFEKLDDLLGLHKKLYMEMNYDSNISRKVQVKKIGGFCIDLSHFKAAEEKWSKEFEFIIKRKNYKRYFGCNHINGYSYKENRDLHWIENLHDFDYLKTLPKFVFGKIIAIETFNSITEQLKYKKQIIKLLK